MCGQTLVKSYSNLLKCQSLVGIQIDRVRRWPISSNSSFALESFFSFLPAFFILKKSNAAT